MISGFETSYSRSSSIRKGPDGQATGHSTVSTFNKDLGNPEDPGTYQTKSYDLLANTNKHIHFNPVNQVHQYEGGVKKKTILPKSDENWHLRDYGYSTSNSDRSRRIALNKAANDIGTAKVIQSLNLKRNKQKHGRNDIIRRTMSADIEYLQQRLTREKKGGTSALTNPLDQPFSQTYQVNGKPMTFFNNSHTYENSVNHIDDDLIPHRQLLDIMNNSNPSNIIWMNYDGLLSGVAVIEYTPTHIYINAFAANKGFRSPLIKFIRELGISNHRQVVVRDRGHEDFWNTHSSVRDTDGFVVL